MCSSVIKTLDGLYKDSCVQSPESRDQFLNHTRIRNSNYVRGLKYMFQVHRPIRLPLPMRMLKVSQVGLSLTLSLMLISKVERALAAQCERALWSARNFSDVDR